MYFVCLISGGPLLIKYVVFGLSSSLPPLVPWVGVVDYWGWWTGVGGRTVWVVDWWRWWTGVRVGW